MPARLKFNIFSPLPPVRSEIANVTRLVAQALRPMADITLWTAQSQKPVLDGPEAVMRFEPDRVPWAKLQEADLNIYNIGNNATFHRSIFDVARQAPGLVVLHDTRLQHFFARYSETPGPDRAFYLESMQRSHGLTSVADAEAFLAGQQGLDTLVERYPMTLAALDGALAAVIHNDCDRAALAGQTRTPVFYLPLPFAGPGLAMRPPPNGTLRLIAFGHMGFNRRLDVILEALAGHDDAAIRLDIYGVLEEAEAVQARSAALGLGARVQFHGFVPEPDLTAALARADLALNLRYPSMGEASASQLRIWDSGLPSLVTRTGWYASLPADAVFFVEPADEIASIRAHLTALRRSPAAFRRAGLRGREILLEQHAPAAYAQALLAIAQQAPALHARRQAIAMSRIAANGLMELTGVAGITACAEPVAQAVRALTQTR
jgi:glycosyltransferase involved in cell wall biosynthesis